MKGISYLLCTACLLVATCTEQEIPDEGQVPEGMVEVRPSLSGMLTAASVGSKSSPVAWAATRMTDEEFKQRPEYKGLLDGKPITRLDNGATLWLLIEGQTNEKEKYRSLKSYVVKGYDDYQSLYPCTVDAAGSVLSEEVAPLYLPYGTYTFRALSPARAFLDEHGEPVAATEVPEKFRMRVANGDYLIANDERYSQTRLYEQTIEETGQKVQVVKLNPLINQTARLKFSISLDPEDPYLHSCDVAPTGVEISGLQQVYGNEEGRELWNWSPALADTLVAYPGMKEEQLVIRDDHPGVSKQKDRLVIETAVLPTDATSTSIIVLFNLIVNGMPTQYEMMLNQKVLRAGFSYHYKGVLSIVDGITAIAWQNVAWETDVEIDI